MAEMMAPKMVGERVGMKVGMMVANWDLYLAVLSAALLVGLKALRLVELKVASTVVWRAV